MLAVSVHISQKMKKTTRIVIVLLFVETIFFCFEAWARTFEEFSVLRPIVNATLYSVYPIIMILVIQIAGASRLSRKAVILLWLPEIVSVPLFYSSQWTHLIYWVDEGNKFTGGPLRYWPYILFGFYAVLFLVFNAANFKKYSVVDLLVAAYLILVPIAGVLFFLLTGSGKDYSSLFTSAILLNFIYLYIHLSRIDALTLLLNRQSYYQAIRSRAKYISGVVSVDMNDLKYLNDNMGHEAGDKALKTVADVMRDHHGRGGKVYRVGGDEFMIVYTGASESEIQSAVATMRKKMSETPYTCAFGYAMKEPNGDVADAIRESDKRMYADKAELKKKRSETSGDLPDTP